MSTTGRMQDGMTVTDTRDLSSPDHQRLVVDFNRSASPYPADRTIVDLFVAQVLNAPGSEAIRHGDRALTYRELDHRSDRLAAHLRTMGVRSGHLVVVFMDRTIETVCAILAVLKAGAAYVPIDSATPSERLGLVLADAAEGMQGDTPILLTQTSLRSSVPSVPARVIECDGDRAWDGTPGDTAASKPSPHDLAYVIFTSGSTGKPKGVMIEHRSLVNYIHWAVGQYSPGEQLTWPLFSSIAFDLTVTSIFAPLVSGGRIVVYGEESGARGAAVLKVVEDGVADIVKLTPPHLAMIKDMNLSATRIRRFIVGGEDFKTSVARDVTRRMGRAVDIYNEYGPTEATVGCMIHRYDRDTDVAASVPIGRPSANAQIYILDERLEPVGTGVIGEMYLGGDGLARGYFNRPELTAAAFVQAPDPRRGPGISASAAETVRLYKTGDLARWSPAGQMEFLGRADHQVKIGAFRIELGEIEAALSRHPAVRECVVTVARSVHAAASKTLTYCSRCGLASSFPGTTYDAAGVCNVCRAYDSYAVKAEAYFKSRDELKAIIAEMQATRTAEHDCVVLYSGGKDSTYMLYQLRDLGVKPLVFFLDNGFISEEAKANIHRVVDLVGVDLVVGTTPHMNEIFVDSINRFANVCNGCFKTIYTLAANLANERGIRYIFTGLSRGQFFETRLTEDVFRRDDWAVDKLDALILEARKAYHEREDAVSCHLAVDIVRGDGVLDNIQFVDFYRYWSVPLEELYAYLRKREAWVRPSDTGRSTNCLINDVGIYLHKKQRGFHNYSLPYSWDVRLGQKTRDEAMEELEDEIDESRVRQIMAQIGYAEPQTDMGRLVAYYVSDRPLDTAELHAHLAPSLPDYMIPDVFVRLDRLPLAASGKVDRNALPAPPTEAAQEVSNFVGPRTDVEKTLAGIWVELLNVEKIGINDEFFELGGHSLLAIRAVSRIRDVFAVEIPFSVMFKNPTIAGLAEAITTAQGHRH